MLNFISATLCMQKFDLIENWVKNIDIHTYKNKLFGENKLIFLCIFGPIEILKFNGKPIEWECLKKNQLLSAFKNILAAGV